MPSRPLLVIGGAGYIGSHTVLQLLDQHERVIVLDNLVMCHPDVVPLDPVTLIQGPLAVAARVAAR